MAEGRDLIMLSELLNKILAPGIRVLDLPILDGFWYPIFKKRKVDYLGISVNPEEVKRAKQNHPGGKFQLVDDYCNLHFEDNSYQLIFVNNILWREKEYLRNLIRELRRVCYKTLVIIAPLFLKNALDEILSSQNLRFECKNPLNKVSFYLIKIDKKVENEYYRKQRERSANTRRFPKNQELLSKALDLFLPKIKSNARILDIGCGDGWGMSEMICRGYCNVAGIDIGEKTIEVAKSYGLEAKTEDMHKISFPDDSFDAIFCRHTLEHAHTPLIVLRHCQRILKNKGKIFLIVPVEKNVPFGHHYMRFNKEVIRCLFSQAGINIISLKEEPRELYVWGEVKKVDY